MGGGERKSTKKSTVHFRTGRKWAVDLVQVLPNALYWLCVSIKHALKEWAIKTVKPLISQGFQVSVSILVTQDVLRDRFRYTLEIGKNESWSGFELFQLYFFAIDCPSLRIIGSFLRVTKIDTALPTWILILFVSISVIRSHFWNRSYGVQQ